MKYVVLCLVAALMATTLAFAGASGEELYAKSCKGCHGSDGKKVGMGMSKPLSGMPQAEARAALLGYKAGTFGGDKKVIMERTVKTLSDEDLEALAKYISGL